MLIRVSSGAGGIVEYLEKGQKKDRWFDRDELDERVIIDGDINQLDNVINSIDDESPTKYFHYTLSFKEQHISPEVLEEISREFKQFIKTAYLDDELEFYAEAHLPKIKSYTDANGEIIDRYPHIHVVIPKINLLDGNTYDPMVKRQIKYMDSWQEYINHKYGLESPKDNLRQQMTSTSEIISRYKYDIFTGKNLDFKNHVLDIVLNKNITSQRDLYFELEKQGYKIKLRNPTKPEQSYINVTLPNETKGINLKESVFRDDFLKLTAEEKLQKLNAEVKKTYTESGSTPSAELSDKHQYNLKEWQQYKALELRYTHNHSSKQNTQYNRLPPEEKIKFLKEKHQQTLNNYLQLIGEKSNEEIGPISKHERDHLVGKLNRDLKRVQQNIDRIGITNPTTRERIRKLAARSNRSKHRADLELGKTAKRAKSATEQLKNGAHKTNMSEKHEVRITELNSQIKADILLELAQKTHGINPDIYEINVDKNGSDRIKCGTRNLNVVDFATKEMNLSFKEAIPYLKNVLNAQNDIYREQPPRNKKYLRDEYQKWFTEYKSSKSRQLDTLYNEYKQKRQEINNKYKYKLQKLRANGTISMKEKQFEIAILKSQKILELNALEKANKHNQDEIKTKFNTDMRKSYQTFLLQKVSEGDEDSLAELRRLKIKFEPLQNSISSLDKYQEFKLNINYDIDINGVIRYQIDNKTIIEDEGKRINVKQGTEENIKLSLELSVAKFGNRLTLDGDESFRKKVVETAIKNNMQIEFLDEFSKKHYQETMQKLRDSTTQISNYNQQAIERLSDERTQYIETKAFNILDEKNRVKTVNLHYIKDLNTSEIIPLQSKYMDYLHKNNELSTATFFDTKIDNEVILKRSKETLIKKDIRAEIIKIRQEEFKKLVSRKHQINTPEAEYSGKFIKIDKSKFGKEYALIKTKDGLTKFDKPEFVETLKQLKLTNGDLVNIAHVKTEQISNTRPKKVTNYNNQSQKIDYNSLQLIADLEVKNKDKIRKECMGEVVEIKLFNSSNTDLYRTVLRDKNNELQVLFLKSNENISVGDYSYIRQGYKSEEVINLTSEYKSMIEKNIPDINQFESIENAVLTKYGYRQIRDNEVFYAEFKITDNNGNVEYMTKCGDKLKKNLMDNNITPGTTVLITNSIENENYIESKPIVEAIHLDKDMALEVDQQYNKLITQVDKDSMLDFDDKEIQSDEIEL